jgi:hypothetical protein
MTVGQAGAERPSGARLLDRERARRPQVFVVRRGAVVSCHFIGDMLPAPRDPRDCRLPGRLGPEHPLTSFLQGKPPGLPFEQLDLQRIPPRA